MRAFVTAIAVVALGLGMWGCGGSSYASGNSGNAGNPMAPTSSPSGVVTINVVAVNGAQSFSPNPASLPVGQMVVWRNVDSITHHVVHPVMVGSVNQDTSNAPVPCQGAYCD
jgi:plastocyanin